MWKRHLLLQQPQHAPVRVKCSKRKNKTTTMTTSNTLTNALRWWTRSGVPWGNIYQLLAKGPCHAYHHSHDDSNHKGPCLLYFSVSQQQWICKHCAIGVSALFFILCNRSFREFCFAFVTMLNQWHYCWEQKKMFSFVSVSLRFFWGPRQIYLLTPIWVVSWTLCIWFYFTYHM